MLYISPSRINLIHWRIFVMNDNRNSKDDLPGFIKSIRQKLGVSQEELAQRLGVSFTSVNRWENGQTKPSKLARRQLDILCKKIEKLKNPVGATHGD